MRARSTIFLFAALLAFVAAPAGLLAQTKKRTPSKRAAPKPSPSAAATPAADSIAVPVPEATPPPSGKKNARTSEVKGGAAAVPDYVPVYTYTFERPGFTYSKIRLEHDEDGKGRVWFTRDADDLTLDDPIQVPAVTLAALKETFEKLDFLNTDEDYQYPARDYAHMGNVTISVSKGGRSRTAKYNWTQNKSAKALMDIYRSISNEAVWKFEMLMARDSFPLMTPSLIDQLDGHISRDEIPDPPHLLPFLTQLSTDERLPLIARNHLLRVIQKIEKRKK